MFQVTYVALQINHLNACFRTTHLGPGRVSPFWQRPGLNHLCDMFFKLQQRNKIKMSVPPAYPFIEESILAECQQCDNKKKYPEKQISMAINKLSNLFITAGSWNWSFLVAACFLVFFVCANLNCCVTHDPHTNTNKLVKVESNDVKFSAESLAEHCSPGWKSEIWNLHA